MKTTLHQTVTKENFSRSAAMLPAFLAVGLVLWACLAGLNVGLHTEFIYEGYPRSPAVQMTVGKMVMDAGFCALPGALLAAALAFTVPRGVATFFSSGAAFLLGLWVGRELVGQIYVQSEATGGTRHFGEAAAEMMWHPVWGWITQVAGVAAAVVVLRSLRARQLHHANS